MGRSINTSANTIFRNGIKVESVASLDGETLLSFDKVGDDRAIHLTNAKLEIGALNQGRESIFGEGNSFPIQLAYHAKMSNMSGNIITSAVDITTILQSEEESTTGLFGGNSTGDFILVGCDYTFPGIKAKIDTPVIINGEDYILEALKSNGFWEKVELMNTNASFPLQQRANHIGLYNKEQWFFGFDPLVPSTWNKMSLNVNGVVQEKFWGRLRLVNNIAQDMVIEQVKLRTNSTEINEDGTVVLYGKARRPRTLQAGLQIATPNALNDPANEVVSYGTNYSAKFIDNEFKNSAKDGFGIIQNIDYGIDTSIPITISLSYYVKGGNTGDVEITAEVFQVTNNFVYDGNATPEVYTVIDEITLPSDEVRRTVYFTINASYVEPTEALVISLTRDARNTNANDTLSNAIIITHVTVTGYEWRG